MHFALPFSWRKLLTLALMVMLGAADAAQSPSPEQLEIFRNLTPEQQRALLEQLADPNQQQFETATPRRSNQRAQAAEDVRRRQPGELRDGQSLEPPTIKPEDTVLIEVEMPDERDERSSRRPLSQAESERLERLVEQVRARNPYQLDRNGQLNLPGLPPIGLGGLTDEQATQRLSLEPALIGIKVRMTRLPLDRTGVAGLKPFGYDLFDNSPATFEAAADVPVPAEYVIGPGDELSVQLFGGQNRNFRLLVTRDGVINFPELGPINVGGMTFNAARAAIETRVEQQMIGVKASVTVGETRAIRVLVTGEVNQPGYYTVSGLATMTGALYASGGIKPIGSLRDIQLKRQGQVVRRLDLYDLLIRGDTSDDARLLPGDAIFIPPVGPTVAVEGEVKRPAIYELRDEATVAEIVRIAGGLTAEADSARVSLTQVDQGSRRVVLDVNLTQSSGTNQRVGNGAVLRVARLRPQIDAGIEVVGEVYRPGPVAWREGLRLTDVISSIDELRPNADQNYVLIRRESGLDRRISAISADLAAALAAPGSDADVLLVPRDRIRVFDLSSPREQIIQSLLEEIRLQSDLTRQTEVVRVGGRVKVPGEYPLEPGMRVSDLIRAGGNLDPAAFGGDAELTRYAIGPEGGRLAEVISIDLASILRKDPAADILLQPSDFLIVRETPDWSDDGKVTLRGEVRFPGTYPIRKGETLRQLLDRAGGLTSQAFPEGSVFMRADLRDLEQQLLDQMQERIRADVAGLALQAANAGQSAAAGAFQSGQSLLSQLQTVRATGRLVIDLPGLLAMEPGAVKDVILRNGDELVVPKRRQEVTVLGEVQNATSHLFLPELKRADYVELSGGTTRKADKSRIYVVRADGSVASQGGSLLRRRYDAAIKPGDTIVVPLNTERMPRLPFWQAVTSILYNLAVSVAAVNSF